MRPHVLLPRHRRQVLRLVIRDHLPLGWPELATLPAATTYPPAPIPSAVDPHTVERAWALASKWSAPLNEDLDARGHARSTLSGPMAGRMGAPPAHATPRPHSQTAPHPSRSLSAPAGGTF